MYIVRPTIATGWLIALAVFCWGATAHVANAATKPVHTTIYNFPGAVKGAFPQAGLVVSSTGTFYGTTYSGGKSGWGTVFQLTPPTTGTKWTYAVLYSFLGGTDGANPQSDLIIGANGVLYGTTYYGGSAGYGTVYQLTPMTGGTWTETVLYSFLSGTDGANPQAGLLLDSSGNLYGTTAYGGTAGYGTVFELSPPTTGGWTEQVLYSFTNGSDGANPMTDLLMDSSKNLYGTAYQGGTPGWGTVFQLVPPSMSGGAWTFNLLYAFTGLTDGGGPSRLAPGPSGSYYGTTFWGGLSTGCPLGGFVTGCGTAFQLTPGTPWTLTVLYTFTGTGTDGAHPSENIAIDSKGALYMTTYSGGSTTNDVCFGTGNYPGCGTIIRLRPPTTGGAWTESVLYIFNGGSGGAPNGVIRGTSGLTLYGTTALGGNAGGNGTAYELKQ